MSQSADEPTRRFRAANAERFLACLLDDIAAKHTAAAELATQLGASPMCSPVRYGRPSENVNDATVVATLDLHFASRDDIPPRKAIGNE